MHVPDEVNTGLVQAVAIVGAALRFPGASDPASFHELTVSGRRMFRELGDDPPGAAQPGRKSRNGRKGRDGTAAGRAVLRAALLDEQRYTPGRDDALTGGVPARHVLATETALAALADVPPAGRVVAPGRIGVFIADMPEPGTTDVRDWGRHQLRLLIGGDGTASAAGRRDVLVGSTGAPQSAGASVHDLLFGTIDLIGRNQGVIAVNGTAPGGQHC